MSESNLPGDLESALENLRQELPASSADIVASRIGAQITMRKRRLAVGASVLGVAALVAVFGLLPQHSIASLQEAAAKSKAQTVFYTVVRTYTKREGRYENLMEDEMWRSPDLCVMTDQFQRVDHKLEPNLGLNASPKYSTTNWSYADGRWIVLNANFRSAVAFKLQPSTFQASPTLNDYLSDKSRVWLSLPGVKAHGGVFDEYLVKTSEPQNYTIDTHVFADPSTHLIRFVDTPLCKLKPQDMSGGYPQTPTDKPDDLFSQSVEIRYLSPDELKRQAPKLAPEVVVRTPERDRERFLKQVEKPVASQVVGGIRKDLFAVVIKSEGEIVAITQGGAPRDQKDAHEIEVLNAPTRILHEQPPYLSNPMIEDAGLNKILVLPYSIGGKEYVVEATRRALVGPTPEKLTIKVPVWRYDTSHLVTIAGHPKLYPSIFVGYATFTTDAIFEMPGGRTSVQAGATLPSGY